MQAHTASLPGPVQPAVSDAQQRRRILLVDDERDAVESMAALLTMRGSTVRTVLDGVAVLPAAREFQPDAIVLDIGLPGTSGYDICRMIRQEVWGATLPLIALTGWGQPNDHSHGADAGFDRHISKPVHPDQLMRVISELVDRPGVPTVADSRDGSSAN